MRYFLAVPSKFACANSNFENNFSILCAHTAHEAAGGGQYFPCYVCYSHDECLFTCHCTREWLVIGMPSPTMNQKLITIKFLGKCWYGGHPWIRLAMDCERNGGKEINFTFCLGTAYDVSRMEDIGNSWSFLLTGKACLSKYFFSLYLSF